MSVEERKIACRRCHETIPLTSPNCPHCGASVRNSRAMGAAIVVGLIVFGASLSNISDLWVFGAGGVLLMLSAGALLYNKRQRIQEAGEDAQSIADLTDE